MKKRVTLLALLISLLMVLTSVSLFGISEINTTEELTENFISEYFSMRQDSVTLASDALSANTNAKSVDRHKYSAISKTSDANILKDENNRITKLLTFIDKSGYKSAHAKTLYNIFKKEYNLDSLIMYVYEWTTLDCINGSGKTDICGYGTTHKLTFDTTLSIPVLVDDYYNEGPLTDMKSSSYTNSIYEPYTLVGEKTHSKEIETEISKIGIRTSDLKTKTKKLEISNLNIKRKPNIILLTYYSNLAANYADMYVGPYDLSDTLRDYNYYSSAYKNLTTADCVNYVSQCMYSGGMTMSGNWYYNWNNTYATTADDYYGSAWTSTTSHRSYFSSIGTLIVNPSNSQIIVGSPVYYDWDANGSWNHTAICVGTNANGTKIINQHNYDYYHVVWNYSNSAAYSTNQL